MSEFDFRVRQMCLTDVEEVVEVHLAAFSGFFLSRLGPRFLETYYKTALSDPGTRALVAVSPSGLIGFGLANSDPGGFYSRLLRDEWLRFAVAALPALLSDPAVVPGLWRALNKPADAARDPGIAGLFSLAVLPSMHGHGVGSHLVRGLVSELGSSGATGMTLETDARSNQVVRQFYEGMGFTAIRRYEVGDGREMIEYHLAIAQAKKGVTPDE